ncbi:MAG TPA: winged helix-turn-helix domain-containing protein [Nitrosopumilaceae archaeon]|nr:winged helix-turn-helix domain-containing protein [Nitrosopumilaceae archaeon]
MSLWKRGFLEIIAEILDCIKSGNSQKTQISAQCKLDSRMVKKYLKLLESVDLVKSFNGDMASFKITEKGIRYLDRYNSFMDMLQNDLKKLTSTQLVSFK